MCVTNVWMRIARLATNPFTTNLFSEHRCKMHSRQSVRHRGGVPLVLICGHVQRPKKEKAVLSTDRCELAFC